MVGKGEKKKRHFNAALKGGEILHGMSNCLPYFILYQNVHVCSEIQKSICLPKFCDLMYFKVFQWRLLKHLTKHSSPWVIVGIPDVGYTVSWCWECHSSFPMEWFSFFHFHFDSLYDFYYSLHFFCVDCRSTEVV